MINRHIYSQINESVEQRNLRRHMQQPGESFDDFLVTLRELAKTCNFCSDACTQKNIWDQIIEGTTDGDTVEQLPKQPDLTLEIAITLCKAQKAAKKQCREISDHTAGAVFMVRQCRQPPSTQLPAICPGCEAKLHMGGQGRCPAYNQTCHHCNKTGHFARVCWARQTLFQSPGTIPPPTPSTRPLQAIQADDPQPPQLQTI